MSDDNWLETIAKDAAAKFAAWPKWKQDAHREELRRSFVHGNCAIENPLVTRKMVDEIADAESAHNAQVAQNYPPTTVGAE